MNPFSWPKNKIKKISWPKTINPSKGKIIANKQKHLFPTAKNSNISQRPWPKNFWGKKS